MSKKARKQLTEIVNQNNNKLPSVKTLKSKHPEIYSEIVNGWKHPFTSSSFAEMTYNFLYPGETICKQGNRQKYESFTKGYVSCSKSCMCALEKKKESTLINHGVEHALQSDLIKKKMKDTFVKRYGVENLHEINVDKKQKTNLARYGSKTPLESHTIRKKASKTLEQKYGFPNNFDRINSTPELKKKSIQRYKQNITDINLKRSETNRNKNPEWYDYDKIYDLLKCYSRSEVAKNIGSSVSYIDKVISDNDWSEFMNTPSYYEVAIEKLLQSHDIDYSKNDRSIIPPKEIDFFINSKNVAIEFNGIRWHGEKFGRDKQYHLNKTNDCQKKGIKLLQIFQDEWDSKPEVVRDLICRHFKQPSKKIAARKCDIKTVSHEHARQFYDTYHLQGNIYSKLNYGLYHDDELISMMSFKKGFNKTDWELTRYCNIPDIVIIGGAQRLFKKFMSDIQHGKCYTYSDKRWFTGDVYKKLGFTHVWDTQPNYWYTRGVNRYHRLKFTKQKLVKMGYPSDKTEKQIMKEIGYDVLWDCGNKRWEMTF